MDNILRQSQSRYRATCQFLKEKKLHALPCFLIIGPSQSGKTSLLKNAELGFILEKKIEDHQVMPTTSYDWWVTKDTIYIDTPGNLFNSENSSRIARQYFLGCLKKHCYQKNLAGVILVLSIDQLLNSNNLKELLNDIGEVLHEIYKKFKKPPVSIIINKCDLLTGFREFFCELSRDERWQYWGIPLETKQELSLTFSAGFDALIQVLKEQLIWRLQHEQMPDRKALINDFPLQIKQLKPTLVKLFKLLGEMQNKHVDFCNLFFTAAAQKPDTPISATHSKNARSQLINIQPPTENAYFIHDFFQHHILTLGKLALNKSTQCCFQDKIKALVAMLIVGLAIFSSIFWTKSFKHQIKHISKAEQAITTYHVISQNQEEKTDFKAKLKSLDALQQATLALSNKNHLLTSLISPNHAINSLKNKTSSVYQYALRQVILPKVTQLLINELNSTKTTADIQYASLEAYLMLTDPKYYNALALNLLLQKIWQAAYPHISHQKIFSEFNDLFDEKGVAISQDQTIIENARNNLLQLHTPDLAYIIFQNSVPNNQPLSLNLENNNLAASVLTFANPNSHLNSMYTAKAYQGIPDIIQKSSQEALQGNWVLGERQLNQNISIDGIAKEVQKQYLQDYANAWLDFLNNIKIVNFTQLDELNNALILLTNKNSLLIQLANLVNQNIVNEAFENNVQLNGLAKIVQNNSDNAQSIDATIKLLQQLQTEIKPLLESNNPNMKSFDLAVYRMRNNGQNDTIEELLSMASSYPEPLKSWLATIASNAWQTILFQAQEYINLQWKKEVTPQYNAQLANRFPFDENASQDASLESFTYFFAPNALLDNFFAKYLQPFINTSQMPWKAKSLDGSSLQISRYTLTGLQKIKIIRNIYFGNNDRNLFLPFDIGLTDLSNHVNTLKITLGQQSFSFDNPRSAINNTFIWPDDFNANLCRVIFTDSDNQQNTINCDGPWGFFKLLRQSQLQQDKKTHRYSATFADGDDTATIRLTTTQRNNPFSLGLLNHFRLPDSID